MIHDGHVHTPYCPHGTKDELEKYCETAIQLGMKGLTFTEHAPLPSTFNEPTPMKDSGMDPSKLEQYMTHIQQIKEQYKGSLNVLLGLEVDYIEGFETETTNFLNEVGPHLDDCILSVHFLKIKDQYLCIDYSPEVFAEAVQMLGSIDRVHRHYYQTILRAIQMDLGPYKPKRIGHLTLVRKFQKKFPTTTYFSDEITTILTEIKERGYELDYNGAGFMKPLCKEPYPCHKIIDQATRLHIPLVFGSDAHQAKALLNGFDQLVANAPLIEPSRFKK